MRTDLAIVLALAGLAACGTKIEDDSDGEPASYTTGTGLSERGDRRMYWGWANLPDYTFIQGGFDGQSSDPDVLVTVRDKAVVSGVYLVDHTNVPAAGLADLYTIDGIFDLIDQRVMDGVYRIDIAYDPARSFPTSVSIYPSRDGRDDEEQVTVKDLMPPQVAESLANGSSIKEL